MISMWVHQVLTGSVDTLLYIVIMVYALAAGISLFGRGTMKGAIKLREKING